MANIVMTSDAACVHIELNDLATLPNIDTEKVTYARSNFAAISKRPGGDFVTISMDNAGEHRDWDLSHNGASGSLPVDSINGVTPTDVDHLYNLLETLFV